MEQELITGKQVRHALSREKRSMRQGTLSISREFLLKVTPVIIIVLGSTIRERSGGIAPQEQLVNTPKNL